MALFPNKRAQGHYKAGTEILTKVGHYSFIDEWRRKLSLPKNEQQMVKRLHSVIKNLEEAVKHLKKAVELDPDSAYSFHNLAHAWYNIAEYGFLVAYFQGSRLNVEIIEPGMWYEVGWI